MIAWVKLKYQHMVDTRGPPAICVDSQQEDKQHDEEQTTINSQGRVPVHSTWLHSVMY